MSVRTQAIRLAGDGSAARLRTIGTWGKRPLDDLAVACRASSAVDKLIRQSVAFAREQGRTWRSVPRSTSRSSRHGSASPVRRTSAVKRHSRTRAREADDA